MEIENDDLIKKNNGNDNNYDEENVYYDDYDGDNMNEDKMEKDYNWREVIILLMIDSQCFDSHQTFHILIADNTDLAALSIVDESRLIDFFEKSLFWYLFLKYCK